eukprot:scaffold1130_cov195-Pinguiococcus_pyrenoidosus.AAC.62
MAPTLASGVGSPAAGHRAGSARRTRRSSALNWLAPTPHVRSCGSWPGSPSGPGRPGRRRTARDLPKWPATAPVTRGARRGTKRPNPEVPRPRHRWMLCLSSDAPTCVACRARGPPASAAPEAPVPHRRHWSLP